MKITFNILLFSTIFGNFSCQNAKNNKTDQANIYALQAASMLLTVADFEKSCPANAVQLVDVRTPDEFAAGTLTAAVNIDFNNPNFAAELQKLDTYKPLCIFCQKGGRSAKAHEIAKKVGFQQVIELNGGYEAWQKAKNR